MTNLKNEKPVIEKIKLPVRYDPKGYCIRDEIGGIVCTMSTGLIFVHEKVAEARIRADAEQIVHSLNNQEALANECASLRKALGELEQLLEETFEIKLDNGTRIFRGAWGYQISGDQGGESYDSIQEALAAKELLNQGNEND